MKEQFNYLIENIAKVTIPTRIINGIKSGSITLKLRHKSFNFQFDEILELSTREGEILEVVETVTLGNRNNELH